MKVQDIYYVMSDGRLRSVNDPSFEAKADDIDGIMEEDVFCESTLERVKKDAPIFYASLKENGFASVLAAKIRRKDEVFGYLVCAAKRSHRIWQDNECALIYYLAGGLALGVK